MYKQRERSLLCLCVGSSVVPVLQRRIPHPLFFLLPHVERHTEGRLSEKVCSATGDCSRGSTLSFCVCVCVCVWLLFLFPEEVLLELLLGFSPFGFSHRVYSNSCLSVSFFTHVGLSLNNTDFVRFSAPNWNVCRSTQLSVLAPFRVLFYSPSTLFRIFL